MRNLTLLFAVAFSTAKAEQAPSFRSETKMVLVDTVVTGKKGEYIGDLTAKDFRVWEDNKEQTIRSFSVQKGASADEPSRLVLFFDNTGMSAPDQAGVRQAAARFIDTNAGPGQLIAIVDFDGGFRITQTFTENGARLKEAMRGVKFGGVGAGGIQALMRNSPDAANGRGLIQSLATLARNLNALPGRKLVVLFTGGLSFMGTQPADRADLIQTCNRSNVGVYPVPQSMPQDLTSGPTINAPLNVSGGRLNMPSDIQPDNSIPLAIARGTGGFVLSGSSNLASELRQIGEERNQSYVLGYTPPDSPPGVKDGTCHTLRVKVERGGTEVRARSSYCAEKPKDLLSESRTERDLEKRAAGSETGTAASIQAAFFYVGPGVARVYVAMEIATAALKFENQKGRIHTEVNVLGIASSQDGETAARFRDIVKRDFESQEAADRWKRKPLYYAKEFRILPGQYKLAVVFSSGLTSFGKVETPLTVPAYDRGRFAISALALSKAVRPASELGLEASLIDEGTPLIGGGAQVFPAGTTEFLRSEQLFCYFEIYMSQDSVSATVNLRILDKMGTSKWESGAAALSPAQSDKAMIPVGLNVPIASLPPGAYRLEATSKDSASRTAIQAMSFVVK